MSFEITKEFKELTFSKKFMNRIYKNDEVFKIQIFRDPWFDSEK